MSWLERIKSSKLERMILLAKHRVVMFRHGSDSCRECCWEERRDPSAKSNARGIDEDGAVCMRMRASVGATAERHQSADSAETRGCSYRVLAVARECRCSGTLDALSSLSSGLPPVSAPGKWASAWFRHWGFQWESTTWHWCDIHFRNCNSCARI